MTPVTAILEPLRLLSYPIGTPEKNPVFFEKRVYQGSSGKLYPVPFIDKVYDEAVPVSYASARLENEFIRLVMLPEIGGRIYSGQDKTNQNYDFFYRNDVIKPALVGLAGPWISGGVEFNWPQHHRPSTFLPTDVHIEHEPDGAATVWMSEHEPLTRMKGMHGIRIRPGSSLIELRGRLHNRTSLTRTFLWWANVAALVHDQYQAFFPPDVSYVADHAVRAISSFPIGEGPYYGIDYGKRPDQNDLAWYKNIPVPTSYMVCQTLADFFGGYDFKAGGGFVHIANRHIAPGKKQWTWGNEEFGLAWDRELTDTSGPYIELMAGVYTDNQPDFSYLLPGETKCFSQFWWPIQGIGVVHEANELAALHFEIRDDRMIDIGLNVSSHFVGVLKVSRNGETVANFMIDLSPGVVWQDMSTRFDGENVHELEIELRDAMGDLIMIYRPVVRSTLTQDRAQATEPPLPDEISSADELYFIAEHLELYRHPTRLPEPYLEACLKLDPLDARASLALGKLLLGRGLFADAVVRLKQAMTRLTARHPNPVTGEVHYHLGLAHLRMGHADTAYPLFHKAVWNYEWRSASYYQLATLNCAKGDFRTALKHLDDALSTNRDHNEARVLTALVQRRLGQDAAALETLAEALALDPLDQWAQHVLSLLDGDSQPFLDSCRNDAQTVLDLVFDYADAGFHAEALELLELHHARPTAPSAVPNPMGRSKMTHYVKAWLSGDPADLVAARSQSPDYFFPSRPHEQIVLEWALAQPGADPLAAYGLGNLFYDRRRHQEALTLWEIAVTAPNPQAHRNLGLARWNVSDDGEAARACLLRAIALDPTDARFISEYDQLRQKLNDPLADRLAYLEERRELVLTRDDTSVALAALYNLLDRPQDALDLLVVKRFHPWEGGEGAVLRQYTIAHIKLGRRALNEGLPAAALAHFQQAMDTPENLGEKYHPLQAKADVNYWLARALADLGRTTESTSHYEASAAECGDFTDSAVAEHSPLSYYRGLSLRELGRDDEACDLFHALAEFGRSGFKSTAKIDFFATSLPNLLLFNESLQGRRDAENHLLLALAHHGLGDDALATSHLDQSLAFTLDNPRAIDLQNEILRTVSGEQNPKIYSKNEQ